MKLERLILVALALWLALELARDHFDGATDSAIAAMRTDSLISTLEERGWAVETAQEVTAREMMILDLVDDTTRLARELAHALEDARMAGAEVRAVGELVASATAALQLQGQAFGPDTVYAPELLPDSIIYEVRDSTFGGRFSVAPRLPGWPLTGNLSALIRGVITVTEAGDGRVIFAAIASDPRVALAFQSAYWTPPASTVRCSLEQRAVSAALGSLLTVGAGVAWALR